MVGETISHFKIIDKLGQGGMGEVFLAQDTKLDRKVALKFLPDFMHQDPIAEKRFLREAKSAAALDHPFICHVHEVGEDNGKSFISMEYVKGENLKERLAKGPLPLKDALVMATEIAEALETAHKENIVHRDLKPSNIMLTPDGHVKVMDFGLAKRMVSAETLSAGLTASGVTAGTLAYMSPEQLRGQDVDARSDIFSFGIVLFEMLTGVHPFKNPEPMVIASDILTEDPPPLSQYLNEVPSILQNTVTKMLVKGPDQRYQSISELLHHLDECQSTLTVPDAFWRSISRPRIAFPVVLVLFVGLVFGYWLVNRAAEERWVRDEAIPEIIRLAEEENYSAAFTLASDAEESLPGDPRLAELWTEISTEVSVEITPTGADVSIKEYTSGDDEWQYLGKSPIEGIRIPRGFLQWRITKQGFQAVHVAAGPSPSLTFTLDKEESIPSGMVRVPGGEHRVRLAGLEHLELLPLDDYFIDKYEITNEQFAEFVDHGGYQKSEYWKHDFIKEGRHLSWEEAMVEFRDATGRPGPSTWELGHYLEGRSNFPVRGVSWYEAAAYAEFTGKSLPTLYHWAKAAGPDRARYIVPLSNFGSDPVPIGKHQGLSPYGSYDMAGNVKEWCWNETSDGSNRRYILGGGWSELAYMFNDPDAQSPFGRLPTYGFRCVKYLSENTIPEVAAGPIQEDHRDYSKETPVSDEVFHVYRSFFSYDKTGLNTVMESIDESSEYWKKETFTFDAAYGNERVIAHLFLPRGIAPPYQTVVFFPGSSAITLRSSQNLPRFRSRQVEFIVRSGRAVMYPVYKSTYERGDDLLSTTPNPSAFYRDHVIQWSKDLGRSIDYLGTRDDIDSRRLAYYGFSWGGTLGATLLALEDRFKVAILPHGGLPLHRSLSEVDPVNFASRVKIPVLMLNGLYDHYFPVDTSQNPLFFLLGTPEEDKRHLTYESGHVIPTNELIKESLSWLDRYLGPVTAHSTFSP